MLKIFILVISGLTLSLISSNSFAIVNMQGLHFGEDRKLGISGDVEFLFNGTSGNTDTTKTSLESQINWISQEYINLLVLGYKDGKANGVTNIDNSFAHYRHVHQINTKIDWEAFTQIEQNQFTRLAYRGLVGGGLRFNVSNTSSHKGFLGTTAFYSREKIEYSPGLTDDGVYTQTRANFYFLSRYKATPTIKWANSIYYQPRMNELSDYRALFQSKVDFMITDNFDFRISLDVAYDSEPSQGVEKNDTVYSTGLKWHF